MFNQIIGQESCKEHLLKAVGTNHVSHAYIICGEENSGKLMLAESFAALLQCENGDGDACGVCKSCKQVSSHNHPDIIYISSSDNKGIPVKVIREQLIDTVSIRPFSSKYKIYIVDGADKIPPNIQNILLKTLEEPPSYIVLLLLVDSLESLLSTVRSRCVQLFTTPVSQKEQMDYLVNKIHISEKEALKAASFSLGNIGKAKEIVTDEYFDKRIERVISIVTGLGKHNNLSISDALDIASSASEGTKKKKLDVEEIYKLLDMLELWFRDVLLCKTIGDCRYSVYADKTDLQIYQAKKGTYHSINKILENIQTSRQYLSSSVNTEMLLANVMISIEESF